MPLTLIHGDDIAVSRNYYFELKSKSKESITLDGSKVSLTDLAQSLEGQDLFGDSKEIFIEELLSKKKASKELDAFVSLLLTHDSSPITLWESKELTPKQVANLKKATIKIFKIPATIFALLDAIKPKNDKQLVELFHKTLVDKDTEFVFFMLQRQVRILLAFHSPNNATISEITRTAPWQKGKLEKQAHLFTTAQLVNLHAKLFAIEYGLKTGNLSLPLTATIDLLLLNL